MSLIEVNPGQMPINEIYPSVVVGVVFSNPMGPGWGRPSNGSFEDERRSSPER